MSLRIIGRTAQNVVFPQRTVGSSFALAGSGTTGTYCGTDYWVSVIVFDNFDVHIGVTSGHIYCTGIRCSTGYTSILLASRSPFSITNNGSGYPTWPGDCVTLGTASIDVAYSNLDNSAPHYDGEHGLFDWWFGDYGYIDSLPFDEDIEDTDTLLTNMNNVGMRYMGRAQDFGWQDGTNNGVVYVGGTSTYHNNDPQYPTPVPIYLPDLKLYRPFMPGARRSGTSWLSCNRDGGACNRRMSGAWQNRWNTQKEDTVTGNSVLRRVSGGWTRSGEF